MVQRVPVNVRFDGAANVQGSNIVRMPKLNQGAPYFYGFRIRFETDPLTYRDFSTVVNARWRLKLRPSDISDLAVWTMADGNFEVTECIVPYDTLNFVLEAEDWEGIQIPRSANHLEMDVPFAHVVEFLDAEGVVVERFCQGSGLISVSLLP
jgi:hypothetical protein